SRGPPRRCLTHDFGSGPPWVHPPTYFDATSVVRWNDPPHAGMRSGGNACPRCDLNHEQPRNSSARRPPLLREGARVALVAPAGPLRNDGDLARAIDNVRSFGWEPVVGEHALAREGYFAGPDDQRATDLNGALRDDAVDAIWCLRGGYGAMR